MGKEKPWSPTDPKHYKGKSIRELQRRLVDAEAFVEKNPKFSSGWHNEYIQELRKWIAESIGKKPS